MILLLIIIFILIVAAIWPFVFVASATDKIIKWASKHKKKGVK